MLIHAVYALACRTRHLRLPHRCRAGALIVDMNGPLQICWHWRRIQGAWVLITWRTCMNVRTWFGRYYAWIHGRLDAPMSVNIKVALVRPDMLYS